MTQDPTKQIIEKLGLNPGDQLNITTPQFKRNDGKQPVLEVGDWEMVRNLPATTLLELGCRPWEKNSSGTVLMLLPGEWFNFLPEGVQVEGIFGNVKAFSQETSDDDIRFGVLAYGFRVEDDLED